MPALRGGLASGSVTAPYDCVVGFGANLGDREQAFGRALEQLARLGEVKALSTLYETRPVGGPPQPDYLNAAVRLETALTPQALLEALLRIELGYGRERTLRWGPRTLDLDLLFVAGECVEEPGLSVPHPRLLERAFALEPLLEVFPEAAHPQTGLRLASLGDFPSPSDLQRVAGPRLDLSGWEPSSAGLSSP